MKKNLILLSFIAFGFGANAQTKDSTKPKVFVFHFTMDELQAIGFCLDNTTAPHNTAKAVIALINKQLQSQIDTTKKK